MNGQMDTTGIIDNLLQARQDEKVVGIVAWLYKMNFRSSRFYHPFYKEMLFPMRQVFTIGGIYFPVFVGLEKTETPPFRFTGTIFISATIGSDIPVETHLRDIVENAKKVEAVEDVGFLEEFMVNGFHLLVDMEHYDFNYLELRIKMMLSKLIKASELMEKYK